MQQNITDNWRERVRDPSERLSMFIHSEKTMMIHVVTLVICTCNVVMMVGGCMMY